jgi:hypothetical protein
MRKAIPVPPLTASHARWVAPDGWLCNRGSNGLLSVKHCVLRRDAMQDTSVEALDQNPQNVAWRTLPP